jgi:hypothetical protein
MYVVFATAAAHKFYANHFYLYFNKLSKILGTTRLVVARSILKKKILPIGNRFQTSELLNQTIKLVLKFYLLKLKTKKLPNKLKKN